MWAISLRRNLSSGIAAEGGLHRLHNDVAENATGPVHRHRYGSRAPHRGGQAVKLLMCQRWVYWAAAEKPHYAEGSMIEGLKARVNDRRPYANRRNERRV